MEALAGLSMIELPSLPKADKAPPVDKYLALPVHGEVCKFEK
jgi:hypothetical protein